MSSSNHPEYIEIVVYFADNSGVLLKVREGQNMIASSLFQLVLDELDVDSSLHSIIRQLFSLWLVSDLLELQLKPGHVPFKLVCYWEELLEKYTSAPEEIQQRDEPIIVFRRNVFIDQHMETSQIEDLTLLRYLYHETRSNVIRGKYPVGKELSESLAALQACILQAETSQDGQDIASIGNVEYFKANLKDYLPSTLCKRNMIFKRDLNPEHSLSINYLRTTQRNMSLIDLYKEYLEACRKFFFYGSAYFQGQAEHPGKKIDDPIYIAINTNGVSIIDMDDQILLVSLPFEKLRWQFAESKSNNTNSLPCIFLHFPATEEDGTKVTKLIQIFSKSALLIDNLIEAFVTFKTQNSGAGDTVDGEVGFGEGEISKQFQKLALITYDLSGKKILSSTLRNSKTATKKKKVPTATLR